MPPWKSLAALTASYFVLAACSKQAPKQADATPAPPTSAPPPPAAKAPPPPIAVATPAPVPEKRFAPEGVFYLIRGKSIETADGIVGIKPGTKVFKQKDGKFLVEGKKIALQPAEITNDLDIAARVGNAEELAQLRIKQAALAAAATPQPATPPPPPAIVPQPSAPPPPQPATPATPEPARVAAKPTDSLFVMPDDSRMVIKTQGGGKTITKSGRVWEVAPDGTWKRLKPIR